MKKAPMFQPRRGVLGHSAGDASVLAGGRYCAAAERFAAGECRATEGKGYGSEVLSIVTTKVSAAPSNTRYGGMRRGACC
jgi:hypothetical protein